VNDAVFAVVSQSTVPVRPKPVCDAPQPNWIVSPDCPNVIVEPDADFN
jgi:hypothetical protein